MAGGGNYNESKTGFSFLDATLIVCGGLSCRGPQAEALARVPGLEVGVGDWQSAPDLAAGAKEGMAGLGTGGWRPGSNQCRRPRPAGAADKFQGTRFRA